MRTTAGDLFICAERTERQRFFAVEIYIDGKTYQDYLE
jgi:hypothetical protein